MIYSEDKREIGASDVIENILRVLRDGETHNIEELAESTGLSIKKTKEVLKHLEDIEFVKAEENKQIRITNIGKDFRKI